MYLLSVLKIDYPGYFPDFGILKYLIYAYSDEDQSRAHAVWDGICIVGLPIIITGLWLLIQRILILWKRYQVLQFIHKASNIDPLWNANRMKELACNMFIQVQYAWMKSEFKPLAHLLSDKLKIEWQDTWIKMRNMNYAFLVGQIDITRITIISVEDHLDDYQDKFKVEISGYIKRYIKDKTENRLLDKNTSELQRFTDIYSFVRWEDEWLLDGIQYGAKFANIMKAKSLDYS